MLRLELCRRRSGGCLCVEWVWAPKAAKHKHLTTPIHYFHMWKTISVRAHGSHFKTVRLLVCPRVTLNGISTPSCLCVSNGPHFMFVWPSVPCSSHVVFLMPLWVRHLNLCVTAWQQSKNKIRFGICCDVWRGRGSRCRQGSIANAFASAWAPGCQSEIQLFEESHGNKLVSLLPKHGFGDGLGNRRRCQHDDDMLSSVSNPHVPRGSCSVRYDHFSALPWGIRHLERIDGYYCRNRMKIKAQIIVLFFLTLIRQFALIWAARNDDKWMSSFVVHNSKWICLVKFFGNRFHCNWSICFTSKAKKSRASHSHST